MTTKGTTQSQQTNAPQNPFSMPFMGLTNPIGEVIEHMDSLYQDLGRFQQQGLAQTTETIDQFSKLTKTWLTTADKLASDWREVAINAAKRSAEMMTPRT